jgi:hypothetical protein
VTQQNLQEKAEEFILKMKNLIISKELAPSQVKNADQSRFDKLHQSQSTLRYRGVKQVYATVGSIFASTHSYMIMPVISMAGELQSPMYMLVAESTGKFPGNKPSDPVNLRTFAWKSANMRKQDLKDFLTEVFYPSLQEEKVLLIVDEWSGYKDADGSLTSLIPEGLDFQMEHVPGKCTGMVQPLDVYFFRPYKNFVKYVTDMALVLAPEYEIWSRTNFIKLQSLAHFQFSAERFSNMIKYAFYKVGILDIEPDPFQTPAQYCLDNADGNCAHEDCTTCAFMTCAHCEESFCYAHAIIELHMCRVL